MCENTQFSYNNIFSKKQHTNTRRWLIHLKMIEISDKILVLLFYFFQIKFIFSGDILIICTSRIHNIVIKILMSSQIHNSVIKFLMSSQIHNSVIKILMSSQIHNSVIKFLMTSQIHNSVIKFLMSS